MQKPIQTPVPGTHQLLHGGDVLRFTLTVPGKGSAFLRTNIGKAEVRRAETISLVRTGLASAGQDWHDIRMNRDGDGKYSLHLALIEAGHFEAKCFFMPEDTEEFALAMNGKKADIRKKDFLIFAGECGIPEDAAVKMIKALRKRKTLLLSVNGDSLLPENMKKAFSELIEERCSVLS